MILVHNFQIQIPISLKFWSSNSLLFIPILTCGPFLIIIRLFLLLNKSRSASTTSRLSESSINETFPVWLSSWFWFDIVGLSYMEAEDRHSNSYFFHAPCILKIQIKDKVDSSNSSFLIPFLACAQYLIFIRVACF